MKKTIAILTPIISAAWLALLLLVPSNAAVEYSLYYFTEMFAGRGNFWAFLVSPFIALLFSVIAAAVVLIAAFGKQKSMFAGVLWNGYFVLQLLIHLRHFIGVTDYLGFSSQSYFIYTGVLGALYIAYIALYIVRCRMEDKQNAAESARIVSMIQDAEKSDSLTESIGADNGVSDQAK